MMPAVFLAGVAWDRRMLGRSIWNADTLGLKDPSSVVIDEVAGQWITLLPAALDPVSFAIGFIAFRFLDITKPFPAGWADRNLTGAPGIMLDDLCAGIYAGLVLFAIQHYL